MWPLPLPSATTATYSNWPAVPVAPLPDPGESQKADRHLGLWCGCPLLECCHNEDHPPCEMGAHLHSGSPASGGVQPWEPRDESWRERDFLPHERRALGSPQRPPVV